MHAAVEVLCIFIFTDIHIVICTDL